MISQEEKTSDAKRHLFFSCDINENPFGGAEHGARQREGSSLPKARRKKHDAKRHLFFSCDINENPFGGAEHGARQREGSSLPKARRKNARREAAFVLVNAKRH